jgi:hypothetical protein
MVVEADEFVHQPEPVPGWQENYFLVGWDLPRACGFYVHVERFPAADEVEVKAALFAAGRTVSVSERHPLTDTLDLPGLELSFDEPMHRLRVRLAVKGHAGEARWLAQPGPGTVAMELDVETRSCLGAADWRTVFDQLGIPGIEGEHYEVAGTWAGTLRVGDEVVDAQGLYVRDHSWGGRDYSGFDHCLWTPMVFGDGEIFVTGVTILRQGNWMGFTLIQEPGSLTVVPDPVVRLTGAPTPRGYSHATVVAVPPDREPLRAEARVLLHVPVEYPGFAPGHYMNDALCAVEWGPRQGFGVIELNAHHR